MAESLHFVLFEGQNAALKAVEKRGYAKLFDYNEMVYDFRKPLEYSLPEGFQFVEPGKASVEKIMECCWKGFDHEQTEGPWNGEAESGYYLLSAPHATAEYNVIIENAEGDYVCYAGM